MKIVTDSGADLSISVEEREALGIHVVPLVVTLEGQTYREGVDIQPEDFYRLLESTEALPITSQPAAGDFAETYRRLAQEDPEILSIHISSGLSGTYQSALAGAEMAPEARVTVVDAKTLSAAAGWQVHAAESIYTLSELKYLIHGGRISHMKGLIASVLRLKPLIGVEKEGGTYVQRGQVRTFQGALRGLVDLMAEYHPPGSALRVQVLHAMNPAGAEQLKALIEERFECDWLPMAPMSLVLGAHTGPSMVGVAFAPAEAFAEVP